jgi:hypothetical protein
VFLPLKENGEEDDDDGLGDKHLIGCSVISSTSTNFGHSLQSLLRRGFKRIADSPADTFGFK